MLKSIINPMSVIDPRGARDVAYLVGTGVRCPPTGELEVSDGRRDHRLAPSCRSVPSAETRPGVQKGVPPALVLQYRDVSGSAFGHSRLAARLKTI
jgi:hypothetical protein